MAARTIQGTQRKGVFENQPAAVPGGASGDEPDRPGNGHVLAKSDEKTPSVVLFQPEPGPDGLKATMGTSGKSISDNVYEYLLAIDGQVLGVQAATAAYRGRSVEWVDVTTLRQVRDHLGRALEGISCAKAAAELRLAARQVAIDIRQHRET